MARKRMIDPCIWTDEGFLHSSLPARLLFIGLITTADDEGKGQGAAASLKAAVFPSDDITIEVVDGLKDELAQKMRVQFYESEGRQYYRLCKWHNHQYVQNAKPSKIPDPPAGCEDTLISTDYHVGDTVTLSPNTKQDNTKQDNVSGKKPGVEPAVKRLVDAYHDAYLAKTKEKPTVSGRWGRAFKGWLRAHSEEQIRKVIAYFFAYDKRTLFGFDKFQTAFDNLAPAALGHAPRAGPTGVPSWKCPHCGYWNTQTGSVCYKCHRDRDDKEGG